MKGARVSGLSNRIAGMAAVPGSRWEVWRARWRRRAVESDRPALLVLWCLTLAIVVLGVVVPSAIPKTALLIPMFLGTLWLSPRSLPWFVVGCLGGVVVLIALQPGISIRTVAPVMVTFVIALIVMVTSFRRARLGVAGMRGESMLVDLRDRIAQQSRIPELPTGWFVESAMRSAGGASFSGDFIVASRTTDGRSLELVVVDVSGKGIEAGTRSLQLSGAFGGLAEAVPPERFLRAANEYLLRQEWAEGFATAIHLHLDLGSGDFELRKAGHPPAIWLHGGSGRWTTIDSDGPVLGVLPDAGFERVEGRLLPGDALLLYTDGLVERSIRDIGSGIDRLIGRGQLLFSTGFLGGAGSIIDELAARDDDGALVVVHRRAALLGD